MVKIYQLVKRNTKYSIDLATKQLSFLNECILSKVEAK